MALATHTNEQLQQKYISVCREVSKNPKTSWVLFSHGTVVFRPKAVVGSDLAAEATSVMKEYGPVMVGCSAGDFNIIDLDDEGVDRRKGWAVTGHHSDMLTLVLPGEVDSDSDLVVGLYGRGKRDSDSNDLTIIHVEDRCTQPTE